MGLVVKPLEDNPSPHLSVLLVAPAGFGKTTALLTAPKPICIGDIDGGIESLFKEKVITAEQRKGVDVAPIRSHMDALEFVTSTWQKYRGGTIAFDSFSWFMSNVVKAEALEMSGHELMEKRDWGLYLERGMSVARKLHAIALNPEGCHVIATSHEADKGGEEGEIGKIGPAVSGQLFDILPGIFNFVLFLRIIRTGIDRSGPSPKPLLERKLQTEADQRTPAKSRRSLETLEPPDFTRIWNKVRQKED